MLNILLGRCKLKQEGGTPTPIRRAKTPDTDLSHLVLVTRWSNRNSHSLLLGMGNGATTWEHTLMVSYKIQHFPCPLGAVLCGVYSNELKTYIHVETHTHTCLYQLDSSLPQTGSNQDTFQQVNG